MNRFDNLTDEMLDPVWTTPTRAVTIPVPPQGKMILLAPANERRVNWPPGRYNHIGMSRITEASFMLQYAGAPFYGDIFGNSFVGFMVLKDRYKDRLAADAMTSIFPDYEWEYLKLHHLEESDAVVYLTNKEDIMRWIVTDPIREIK